jgi:hypothetical protein
MRGAGWGFLRSHAVAGACEGQSFAPTPRASKGQLRVQLRRSRDVQRMSASPPTPYVSLRRSETTRRGSQRDMVARAKAKG